MPLTTEEITTLQGLLTAGTLNAQHELLAPLANLGLVLRTPNEENTFKENHKQQVITEHNRDAFQTVTDEFKKVSKTEPKANEKATDYIARVFKELETERDTLKTAGGGTAENQQKITELTNTITKLRQDHADAILVEQNKVTQFKQKTTLDSAMGAIKGSIRKDLDASLVDDVVKARTDRFMAEYTVEVGDDGKVSVKDKNGVVQKNANDLSNKTVEQVMKESTFKDLIEAKQEQPGSGAPRPTGGNGGAGAKPTKDTFSLPATVKTKTQVTEHLMEMGLTDEDTAFDEILALPAVAGLPLR
jgi:hypothetical protein